MRPPYNLARWKENYTFLADETKRSDFFDPIKYIPFGDDGETYLTLGGQWREEALRFDAPNFGFRNARADNYFLHRVLLFSNGHITKRLRVFVELGNELAPGKTASGWRDRQRSIGLAARFRRLRGAGWIYRLDDENWKARDLLRFDQPIPCSA